jgi:peroxiredoxin
MLLKLAGSILPNASCLIGMNDELKKIENFKLENFDGSQFDLYDFGKDNDVLLIFFRGAWCDYCKQQLKDFQDHLSEFNKHGVKLAAIASDTKFKLSLLKTFLGLDFTVLADDNFKVIDSLNLRAEYKGQQVSKPAVFLLNKRQEVIFQQIDESYDDRVAAKSILAKISDLKH